MGTVVSPSTRLALFSVSMLYLGTVVFLQIDDTLKKPDCHCYLEIFIYVLCCDLCCFLRRLVECRKVSFRHNGYLIASERAKQTVYLSAVSKKKIFHHRQSLARSRKYGLVGTIDTSNKTSVY